MRALVAAYILVGYLYAVGMPAGKGPDETAHARYVEYLAQERKLPVFNPADPDPDYEFHQPPLYYLICMPTYLLAGSDEAARQTLRFLTLLLSAALLYLTFALGRSLAPDNPWTALGAAGVVAFLPMQLALSTSIGNDALANTFCAAAVLLLVLYLRGHGLHNARERERAPGAGSAVAVGIMIGLAVLTKSIAVLLFPVAWLAAVLAARRSERFAWRQLARDVALTTGIALLLCGWWLLRNQLLYGDPLAQGAFLQAFEGRRPSPQSFMEQYDVSLLGSYVGEVMIWTAASVTGVFGPVRANRFAFFPFWVYIATGLAAAVAAVGFARYLSRGKLAGWQRQAWGLCALLAALLLASFVQFNMHFFQAQARYLFPALAPAALAVCLGLQEVSPGRWRRVAPIAAMIALGALAVVGLPLWILPQFR
jgi:4-amino-4-deoxy-L-arabinose transferase-like glycosyltransferase